MIEARMERPIEVASESSASAPSFAIAERLPAWGLPEWFLVSQTLLPALLLLPGTQVLHSYYRPSGFFNRIENRNTCSILFFYY